MYYTGSLNAGFNCLNCDYASIRRSNITRHIEMRHLRQRTKHCPECLMALNTVNCVQRHLIKKHNLSLTVKEIKNKMAQNKEVEEKVNVF